MRLLFASSGFESGKDGVGDFARRFADGLIDQGHDCALLALNDAFAPVSSLIDVSPPLPRSKPELRLPQTLPWDRREQVARKFIEEFKPDWICLQFVCYGFQPRGLVANWP